MSIKPLVLITHALPSEWITSLAACCDVIQGPPDTIGFSSELFQNLDKADGLLTLLMDKVGDDILSRAANLKVIANLAVGVDNIDLSACARRGIAVGNTPGVLTDATADLSIALLLAIGRRIVEAQDDAKQGQWKNWAPAGWLGVDFSGATLGIVGMGKIGKAVAKRAAGFGMRILYVDPKSQLDIDQEFGARCVDLDVLLMESDFVSLHCPLTPETRGLIDEQALRKMKPTALLVNIARGAVVNTDGLVRALREGWIAGAALDVTDPEPLPGDHPLYGLKNCLVVPHIGSASVRTRKMMADMACQNILAGLNSKPLPYPV